VNYASSVIVAKEAESEPKSGTISQQELASNVEIGKRMPSVKVLNQSDARPSHLQELLKSNGKWRVVVFPGDVSKAKQKTRLDALGQKLSKTDSFLKRFTSPEKRYDSVIEVLMVHAAPRASVTIFDFPEIFRPYHEIDGWDYWKIFVDDVSYHEGFGNLYETFGIDREEGCIAILRPDQYVSYIGSLDDYEAMDGFFSRFMVPQGPSHRL